VTVFFKSKIKPDDFAKCLLRVHKTLFGQSKLESLCKPFDFHFSDEPSYIGAFYELQAFGIHSIASGVKTQCGHGLRDSILASWYSIFKDIGGPNWEMMRQRVAEYEEFSSRAPTGGLAAQRIFDQPAGRIRPSSQEAFGMAIAMNEIYVVTVQDVEKLFKQYKFDV
jgi:hypothetical protein